MDPDSPLFVAKATLALSALGAAAGGAIGGLRAQNPFALGMTMGINGAITGLTFFGLREYLISPLLVTHLSWPSYTARRHALVLQERAEALITQPRASTSTSTSRSGELHDKELQVDVSEGLTEAEAVSRVRNDRVVDSMIAGGITGGGLSGVFRGKRTIFPAAMTSALIAMLGQYGVNNARAMRLELLASRRRKREEAGVAAREVDRSGVAVAIPASSTTSTASSSTTKPSSPPLPELTSTSPSDGETFTSKLLRRLKSLSPIRKLSDDEYLTILTRQRDEMSLDLAKWEKSMQSRSGSSASGEISGLKGEAHGGGGTGVVDVGALMRQLDQTERKIRGLEEKLDRERRV